MIQDTISFSPQETLVKDVSINVAAHELLTMGVNIEQALGSKDRYIVRHIMTVRKEDEHS